MSSRAAPSVRRDVPAYTSQRYRRMHPDGRERELPREKDAGYRGPWSFASVCKRCQLPMTDYEPQSRNGEYWHIAKPHQTRAAACSNNGQMFHGNSPEIVPYMRKAQRRLLKRKGIRA